MTDLQMLGNSFFEFAWYRRTKDLIMLFDPKVHLFENSLLKVLAQLHSPKLRKVGTTLKLFFATQPFICFNCRDPLITISDFSLHWTLIFPLVLILTRHTKYIVCAFIFPYMYIYSWARIFGRLFSKRCTFGSESGTKSLVRRYQVKFAKTVPHNN